MARSDPRHHRRLLGIRAEVDLGVFAGQALRDHVRLPFAPFHRELMRLHGRMGGVPWAERLGLRVALAAPRGSAKSTLVSLLLPLHDIVYRRESYIVLISATQRQAQQRLRALRGELTGRTRLTSWFPKLREPGCVEASARLLIANGVRLEAFGAGSEMRGISHDSWRPTKIILDDAESSAAAESGRRRTHLIDWFREVVEHLGDRYTHLLAIGTILHREGLLAYLLARPDFEAIHCRSILSFADPSPRWDHWRRLLTDTGQSDRRERARAYFLAHRTAMEQGAEVLWPEKEDYEQLQVQLVTQGRRAFFQEKQNEPLGPEDALFEPERAWRGRRAAGGIEILPPGSHRAARHVPLEDLRLFGYHDAAMGKHRGKGDFAALATVGLAPDSTLVAVSLWVRRAAPSAQVQNLFETHELEPFERLAIEGTGFQELLTLPIEAERRRRREAGRRHDLPVEVVKPSRRKESRIATLEPLLSSGRLVLAESLPEEFWRELQDFPRVEHDDALDALAEAVELALQSGGRGSPPTGFALSRQQSGRF